MWKWGTCSQVWLKSAAFTLFEHRDLDPSFSGHINGSRVAGVNVAGGAHAGIIREHALQPFGRFGGTIGDNDLPGVQTVADAYAAAVMVADPGRPAGVVDQCVKYGPVGDDVRVVFQSFRLTVGAGRGTTIEVIAADDDGRFHLAGIAGWC